MSSCLICHTERQFFEDEIHCVLEILNTQTDGRDAFIVMTPELANKKNCEEYALNKGVDSDCNVHVIVNLSRGRINLTEKDGHWVYISIKSEKEIVYGDPLGGRRLPSNLLDVLNPIYRAKFGVDIDGKNVEIKNCSNNPNFPTQTDSTMCGLIAVMICICSFNSSLYKEIMNGRKLNTQLKFTKNPSKFYRQIRMRMVKIVGSKKYCVEFFFPENVVFLEHSEDIERRTMRKSKVSAHKAWESLMSKARAKPASKRPTASEPPSSITSSPDKHSSCNSKDSLEELRPNAQVNSEVEEQPRGGLKLVAGNFIGLRSFVSGVGYPDNDGHRWQCGKKTKGAIKYICCYDRCTAMKNIFKTRTELKQRRDKRDTSRLINVNYLTSHSCNQDPKEENILSVSFQRFQKESNRKEKADSSKSVEIEKDSHEEELRKDGEEVRDDDDNKQGDNDDDASSSDSTEIEQDTQGEKQSKDSNKLRDNDDNKINETCGDDTRTPDSASNEGDLRQDTLNNRDKQTNSNNEGDAGQKFVNNDGKSNNKVDSEQETVSKKSVNQNVESPVSTTEENFVQEMDENNFNDVLDVTGWSDWGCSQDNNGVVDILNPLASNGDSRTESYPIAITIATLLQMLKMIGMST